MSECERSVRERTTGAIGFRDFPGAKRLPQPQTKIARPLLRVPLQHILYHRQIGTGILYTANPAKGRSDVRTET